MEYKDCCEFQKTCLLASMCLKLGLNLQILQGHTAVYSFTVLKPWYRSTVAILYLIIGIVLARIIDKAYRSYYQKKEDKLIQENNRLLEIKELENGREIMRVRNEQLSLDVDTKSRELAVSAMSLNNKMNCWLLSRMT
jgi:hypothetical protein